MVVMSRIGRAHQRMFLLRPLCLLTPGKKCGASVCEDVNPSCANQFKVLRDMLVNYPPSDGESSSQTNSPSASRISESPLNNVEEGMNLSVRSVGKGALVYS